MRISDWSSDVCSSDLKSWPAESQRRFHSILERAAAVEIACPGGFAAHKMQTRNEWMVDHADGVVALWDGSTGGTANCVAYADKVGKPVTRSEERQLGKEGVSTC